MSLPLIFLSQKTDWSPALVIAALTETGWTISTLARKHEVHPSAISHALRKPWPRVELMIAKAIGVHPKRIWPSRYSNTGAALFGHHGQLSRRRRPVSTERGARKRAA